MKKDLIYDSPNPTRLDTFLTRQLPEFSRTHIQKAIKSGGIKINNGNSKSSQMLKLGDKISVHLPPKKEFILAPNPKVKLNIIFEDKNIIVIDKPAGLLMHPSIWQEKDTLASGLLAHYPPIKNVGDPSTSSGQANLRPGLVHRLDKETSGIIIVAKNQKAFFHLKNAFQNRQVKKEYIALVNGEIKKSGVIDKPIGRASFVPTKQSTRAKKTKEALTAYSVIKNYKNFTLLNAQPKTGRMHQIRVHLASIGHPVAGDTKYGRKKIKNLPRHFLHAVSLTIALPSDKQKTFSAPLPPDLTKFLMSLEKNK